MNSIPIFQSGQSYYPATHACLKTNKLRAHINQLLQEQLSEFLHLACIRRLMITKTIKYFQITSKLIIKT